MGPRAEGQGRENGQDSLWKKDGFEWSKRIEIRSGNGFDLYKGMLVVMAK